MENVLGRNIVGVVASGLVFIGLVFLGVLVVPYLTDTIKILLMFVLSAALTTAGYLLNARFGNNFTKTLLGTGVGAFFISIMVTHLYFHALNEIAAFALLLVWTVAAMWLARQASSLLVVIIAHAGMIISICAGYAQLDSSRLALLMIYQLLSCAVIIGGNLWGFKAMYRFGLYVSLGLTVVSSIVMWARLLIADTTVFSVGVPTALAVVAFLVQFVAGSFVAGLLFASTTHTKRPEVQGMLQWLTVVLWLILLTWDVAFVIHKLTWSLTGSQSPYRDWWIQPAERNTALVAVLVVYVLLIVMAWLRRRYQYSQVMQTVSAAVLAGYVLVFQIIHLVTVAHDSRGMPQLLWLIVPGAVFVLASRVGVRNQALAVIGLLFFVGDSIFMLISGYAALSSFGVVWQVVYLLALLAAGYWARANIDTARLGWDKPQNWQLISFLYAEAALARLLFSQLPGQPFQALAWFTLVSIILLAVIHFARKDRPLPAYRVSEYIIIGVLTIQSIITMRLHLPDQRTIQALGAAACAVCLILLVERIRLAALAHRKARLGDGVDAPDNVEYATAFAITALVPDMIVILHGPINSGYPLSLICMAVALALIALGFWSWVKPLRLYGLAATILCVLKLVTFDVASANTIMRVVAFIGGGLICFGISALYNFASKAIQGTEPVTPVAPPPLGGPSA